MRSAQNYYKMSDLKTNTKKKSSKVLFYLFLLLTILAVGLVYRYLTGIRSHLPTPYKFNIQRNAKDIKEAQEAHILILGDQEAKKLDRLSSVILKETQQNLAETLRLKNWAEDFEGAHRSRAKLQSLNPLPKMVFYMGGSSEFFEKRMALKDYDYHLKNKELYQDDKISSLLMTFPLLSPFIYKSVKIYNLKDSFQEKKEVTISAWQQKEAELLFYFYQLELEEMLRITRAAGTKFILITTPINYLLPPTEVCQNSTGPAIQSKVNAYEKKLDSKRYKESYSLGLKLNQKYPGNARIHYLLGKNALGLGEISVAKTFFQLARALDCSRKRTHSVFNAIMRKLAKEKQIELIDFDEIVSSRLGDEQLFADDSTPQDIFYEKLQQEMIKIIRKYYKI